MTARRRRTKRRPLVLVFGEDENDRRAIMELVCALCPDVPKIRALRRPHVLLKDRDLASQRKNAADIAGQVRTQRAAHDLKLVIAHEDCDAFEPAHESLARVIEERLSTAGCPVVAATPAWEMEAWWYQWPDAIRAVNGAWRAPNRVGSEIGLCAM